MSNWRESMKKYILYLGALVSVASLAFADLANDSASNYTGDTTFSTGANGGTGFGAWTLDSFNGSSYVGGTAIGDPSFGLWANAGGNSSATRALSSDLAIGETLSLDIGHTDNMDGEVGLSLKDGNSTVFNLKISNTSGGQWKIWDGGADFNAGQGWSANTPLSFSFTYNGVVDGQNSYDYSFGSASGSDYRTANAINSIDSIQIYNNGQNGGNLGFDNLSVIPEPATVGLFGIVGVIGTFIRRKFAI